ncbi:WD40 repeat domain-containing protein [Flagellimonas sp.]|uniref:WD40 repeat domain-containing protein n=1 Tax=Flagellimonas sp. TaxID=2058762 RepID=UPI003BAF0347
MKKLFFFLLLYTLTHICCKEQVENKETLWTIAWSPDGKYIATGGNQEVLKVFDAKTFELLKTYPVPGVQLSRLKWHPSKNLLAVITQGRTFKAKILDLDTGKWRELQDLESSFRALDWNHTGELLAVSELEDTVSVYTMHGSRVSRFLADSKGVAGLDWHPSKNIMVTVGTQIGIYTQHGDTINAFEPRNVETFLLCVEWHKSGDFFAVGDYGDLEKAEVKLLQFWNKEGVMLNTIDGSPGEYRNIRWNPNGKRLASASDALRIWSQAGELIAESASANDYLWGVDWSPDGKFIVTSSSEGKIALWDKNANLLRVIDE